MKGLTTNEFIKKAMEMHGEEYDYSKVHCLGNNIKGIKLLHINYLGKKNIRNILQAELY